MIFRLHPAAVLEHEKQVAYYEEQSPGLGRRYHEATLRTIGRAVETPHRFKVARSPDIRRIPLQGFKFWVMGFAFCFGVAMRFLQRGPHAIFGRTLDVMALAVATILPLLLMSASESTGMVQRVMFGVAYIWFGREALIATGKVRETHAA